MTEVESIGPVGDPPRDAAQPHPAAIGSKDRSTVRQLDDVQDEYFHATTLSGDRWADFVATMQASSFEVVPDGSLPLGLARPESMSLDGEWVMAPHAPLPTTVSQADWPSSWMHWSGAGAPAWWAEDVDRSGWQKVQLPATVQAALQAVGASEDPDWGSHLIDELTMHGVPPEWPWHFRRTRIEQNDWWFARSFLVPDGWTGSRLELHFEGISYSASVFLNGAPLGHHTGMFGGPDLDVSNLIREGENLLVVRVDRPPDHWYGRPIGSAGFGWHYGHLIPIGIWRSVELRRLHPVQVRDLRVTTLSIDGDRAAELSLEFDVDNPSTLAGECAVSISMECGGSKQTWNGRVRIGAVYERFSTRFTLERPNLWWPMGLGAQSLYDLQVSIAPPRAAEHHPRQTIRRRVGVRTVAMRTASGWTGESHYRWQLTVNDRDVFMKGANWCSLDSMLRPRQDLYRRILGLCAAANVQVLRAWGAGVVEGDTFYDLCDELGILVYQEFPFAWGPPDAPHSDLAVIDRQVLEIVRRLRDHPSLFLWGGGNENAEPVGSDEVLTLIGRRVRQLDPHRAFHRTSPWGGNEHNYLVYHDGLPIPVGYRERDGVLLGEWGLPSLPALGSIRRYLPPETVDVWPPRPDDGAVLQHQPQFSLHDFVKQARYANFGPIRSWQDMVDYTQLAQAEVLRFAANRLRGRSPGESTGFWFYKVSDLFPGNSWSVIDYYGGPKAAYYTAKRVCRNVTAYLSCEQIDAGPDESIDAQLWMANDSFESRRAGIRVTVFDDQFRVLDDEAYETQIAASDRVTIGRLVVGGTRHRGGVILIRVATSLHSGEEHDDWYWFNARAITPQISELDATPLEKLRDRDSYDLLQIYAEDRPSPLRALPATRVSARLDSSGRWATVSNDGGCPAIFVVIEGAGGEPLVVSDNWLCLLPGEQRVLAIDAPIPDDSLPLTVRAWNAESSSVSQQVSSGGATRSGPDQPGTGFGTVDAGRSPHVASLRRRVVEDER